MQHLGDVFSLEIGIGGEDFRLGHPVGDHPDDGCNRNTKPPDARHPAHLPRIDGNARKLHDQIPEPGCGCISKPAGRPARRAALAGGNDVSQRLESKRQPLTLSASREMTWSSGGTISSGSTRRGARPSRLISRISSAMPGVLAPAPGLTMFIVTSITFPKTQCFKRVARSKPLPPGKGRA